MALIDTIVVPVQGTDTEFVAQVWAVELAAALRVPVRAVHVAPPLGTVPADLFLFIQAECRRRGVPFEGRTITSEDVVGELVEELRPWDLAVVGSRRLAENRPIGSVGRDLVRRAPCPVLIIRLT